ncbi:MAG: hypothetical protein FK734_10695 [Asgard group archaeon]|nr:hypothetical protein [Asgard group archaeon]
MEIRLKQIDLSGALDGQAITYSSSLGRIAWGNPDPGPHELSGSDHIGNIAESRIIFNVAGHDHSGDTDGALVSYNDLSSVPSSFTPSAHKTSHQDGGSDEITVNGLSGVLAQPQTPVLHASRHNYDGDDSLNLTNLSGILINAQKHFFTVDGGSDFTTTLIDLLSTAHIGIEHSSGDGVEIAISSSELVGSPGSATSASLVVWADATGENIAGTGITIDGSDNINMNNGNITSVGTVDGVDVSSHASRHISGGVDPIKIEDLGTNFSQSKFIYCQSSGTLSASSFKKYEEEIASQNVTGTDTVLTDLLTYIPSNLKGIQLFLNGLLQQQGWSKEYILTGSNFKQIYWLAGSGLANNLNTGDIITVSYNTFEEIT